MGTPAKIFKMILYWDFASGSDEVKMFARTPYFSKAVLVVKNAENSSCRRPPVFLLQKVTVVGDQAPLPPYFFCIINFTIKMNSPTTALFCISAWK